MRALVCEAPGRFEYIRREKPALTKDHAIIRIRRIGICGTDLHAFQGTQPFFEYPRIFGHELAGDLVAFDNAPGFEKGETVTIIPYFSCGKCIACRSGKPNCCVDIQVSGVHIDGGMIEYLSVPSYSLVHANGLSYDRLALVEPFSIGAHAVRRANVKKDEFVLVMGAGPIGLGIMTFANIAGANVIALDTNESRLAYCKEKLKLKYTVNADIGDIAALLKEITNGDFPTAVFDATGSRRAINQAFEYIAHGGRYVLVGLQKDEVCFSHPAFHKKEATLMSSRNATRDDFEYVIACLKSGLIDTDSYITHRVMFGQVKSEFQQWLNPASAVIKAMVEMD